MTKPKKDVKNKTNSRLNQRIYIVGLTLVGLLVLFFFTPFKLVISQYQNQQKSAYFVKVINEIGAPAGHQKYGNDEVQDSALDTNVSVSRSYRGSASSEHAVSDIIGRLKAVGFLNAAIQEKDADSTTVVATCKDTAVSFYIKSIIDSNDARIQVFSSNQDTQINCPKL